MHCTNQGVELVSQDPRTNVLGTSEDRLLHPLEASIFVNILNSFLTCLNNLEQSSTNLNIGIQSQN
jgi:hypothetical protein